MRFGGEDRGDDDGSGNVNSVSSGHRLIS